MIDPTLRKILKVEPTNNWAARTLAMRLTSRPDPAAWQEAWSLVGPESLATGETPEDRLVRATVLARSPDVGRRKEAIPAFISLANDLPVYSPLAIDTRLRLTQAMLDLNQFGEAWTTIRPVADDMARPNASALVMAIEALSRSNRPAEAEIRLEHLAAIDPKSPQVRLSKSWILMVQGKKAEAIASLEAAFNESTDAPNAEAVAMHAVDRMIKFGETEASLSLAKKIAARWPGDKAVLARVYCQRNEFDQALVATEAALDAGAPGEAIRFAMVAATARRSDSEFVRKAIKLAEKAKSKSAWATRMSASTWRRCCTFRTATRRSWIATERPSSSPRPTSNSSITWPGPCARVCTSPKRPSSTSRRRSAGKARLPSI